MHRFFLKFGHSLLILFLSQVLLHSQSSDPVKDRYVRARLVGEMTHIEPGQPYRLGLLMEHDPHWHTYWKSSATGYATSIEWELPPGWKVGDIQWPAPTTFSFQGMVEYVYEGKVLLLVTIQPPPSYNQDQVQISFRTDWLMCSDVCVPGGIESSLVLPVASRPAMPSTEWSGLFDETDLHIPVTPQDHVLTAWTEGDSVLLQVQGQLPDDARFFDDRALFDPTLVKRIETGSAQTLLFQLPLLAGSDVPERLSGVLAAESPWPGEAGSRALVVDIPVERLAPMATGEAVGLNAGLLLLAFIGGLILNLMPCVFPVLGIKVMGFVNQAGHSRSRIVYHGLVFTAGVLVSFWTLTAVLLLLRSSGNQLGWGFQLQSPGFVLILALLLFAFALNMSGLFEVGQSAVGIGSTLTGKSGLAGTFFSGILATVVATPCAAPFLAPALGAALTLPPITSFLVFTVIALGLSTPYLLLTLFPGLVNRLPRPGPWMETFRQAMGFLLFATVAYLLWVLAGQLADDSLYSPFSLLNVLLALVLLALGLWIYGRWATFHRPVRTRRLAMLAAVSIGAAAVLLGLSSTSRLSDEHATVAWQKWEPGKPEALARQGHLVYVDFTARWCVTCQTNKVAVFSSDAVLEAIQDMEIVLLKADWTNRDARISEALQKFNRSAVPFNLVYGPGTPEPVLLPEILTPGIVLGAFETAAGK